MTSDTITAALPARGRRAVHVLAAAALGRIRRGTARVRHWAAPAQLGPTPEREIGRRTGART